jgi:hypothetical protein
MPGRSDAVDIVLRRVNTHFASDASLPWVELARWIALLRFDGGVDRSSRMCEKIFLAYTNGFKVFRVC